MRQDLGDAEVVSWRPFLLAVAGVVVASIVFVGWLATGLGGPWVAFTLMDNLAEILAPLAATVACIRAARRRRSRPAFTPALPSPTLSIGRNGPLLERGIGRAGTGRSPPGRPCSRSRIACENAFDHQPELRPAPAAGRVSAPPVGVVG